METQVKKSEPQRGVIPQPRPAAGVVYAVTDSALKGRDKNASTAACSDE